MNRPLRSSFKQTIKKSFVAAMLLAISHIAYAQGTPDLFFSEYLEGSSFNKALEIYNPTTATISFAGYVVEVYINGSATPTNTFTLTGSLPSGAVYVIANSQADPLILAVTDTTSGVCNFNGNDAVVLAKNGTPIDIIGQIGFNPGTNWTLPGGGATSDFTLIRNSNVSAPVTDWAIGQNQWTSQPNNTFTFLGSHNGPVGIAEPGSAEAFAVYPNPSNASFTIQLNAARFPVKAELYNFLGASLWAESAVGRSSVTCNRPFAPGIYLLTVHFETGPPQTRRVVIGSIH